MKKRLDQLIVEKGLVESRTKAQAIIMAGQVLVDGKVADKVGQQIDEKAEIELKEKFPYVSRGALKLEKAYQEFGLNFEDKIVCDIGSSTGGFTDFVLQHGAKKVFAVDVGRGQLDQRLREDKRVVVMERTDFRDIFFCHPWPQTRNLPANEGDLRICKDDNAGCIFEPIDLFVCDVSFISLKKIIPKIAELIQNSRIESQNSVECILLIKPQFEVGKKEADRGKGVIRDPELHKKVIEEIKAFATLCGFEVKGVAESPITGAKGNKEFLLWLSNCHSEQSEES